MLFLSDIYASDICSFLFAFLLFSSPLSLSSSSSFPITFLLLPFLLNSFYSSPLLFIFPYHFPPLSIFLTSFYSSPLYLSIPRSSLYLNIFLHLISSYFHLSLLLCIFYSTSVEKQVKPIFAVLLNLC